MKPANNIDILAKTNVQKAFWALILPTILSQLVAVIYNITDSFWIGQLNDTAQFAAAFLCGPAFLVLVGISNIFGVGGASLIARCLGEKNISKAKSTCAFCIWTALLCSGLYSILFYVFRFPILHAIGATAETYFYTEQYALWTIVLGGIPATFTGLFGHLIRSEGYAKQASFGMIIGLVSNIILDPVFIFTLHFEIAGAAIATVLSMCIGCLYFISFFLKQHHRSALTLNPRHYSARNHIASEVLLVGLPSTLMNFMALFSHVILNVLTASYSTAAITGMGVAKRIDLIVFAVTNGIGQGVLPLIAYNYAARNFQRMTAAIRTTFFYTFSFAIIMTLCLFFGAHKITSLFIQNSDAITYGQQFLQTICLTCPFFSVTLIFLTLFQAIGKKVQPIILSLLRKGGIDIPLMFILNHLIGLTGIAWAFPIEDILSFTLGLILFSKIWTELSFQKKQNLKKRIAIHKNVC